MGRYGDCAILATKILAEKTAKNPRDAWDVAIAKLSKRESSEWVMKKGCPRATFLSLCEEGLIRGVECGKYTRSTKNKKYALNAVKELGQNSKSLTQLELWRKIGNQLAHSCQMDVVLSLWNNDLIVKKDK
ncbi:MAG: hypothetical protein WC379_08290 [Methanoregula sp.]|jgi:hypothetical protein